MVQQSQLEVSAPTRIPPVPHQYQPALVATAILIASGFVHLAIFAFQGASWEGPVSLRKPALFGISSGLTSWSIVWLMTQLKPRRFDSLFANIFAIGLLVEVAIITTQYWRGVASHFNHSTMFDTIMEGAMLGLILAIVGGVFYLTFRTRKLRTIDPSMKLAIEFGMVFLSVSCLLGILTSVLGEQGISVGRRPEIWGKSGVLKFPHGVALHAIQLLPLLAWLLKVAHVRAPVRSMKAAIWSQGLFLAFAIWQTFQGRDRFDCDAVGATLLGLTVLLGSLPVFMTMIAITNLFLARVDSSRR